MTFTTVHMAISLDGFVAGPDQSLANPLGVGGLRLHQWHLPGSTPSPGDEIAIADLSRIRGAVVMGRNMYGPIRGDWDEEWTGWWGDEPPYHAPVYVLTHYEHPPIEMQGGTTFHFVTTGFAAAYEQACAVAGADGEVLIAGGASTVRQALLAGVVDEISLAVSPIVLGRGERLFEGVHDLELVIDRVVDSPSATHLRYALSR